MKAGTLERDGVIVLPRVWRADRWDLRLRGLLRRPPLQDGEGLLIVPCDSVHTMWMGYALDLLFLDRAGGVLRWREGLRPWRAAWCRGAHATLEMPAGSIGRIGVAAGQRFLWHPALGAAPSTTETAV